MVNAIEVENLTKAYGNFILDDVSFALPSGCIMGLIGENGAGKSTIIKLIFNMIKRESGEIRVLGQDNRSGFDTVKQDIGVVLDNDCFPDCVRLKDIDLIMGNIYEGWSSMKFAEYCNSFALPFDKKFKSFSKGMKMKTSIAVALSHGAKLLVLDEATSGLDPIIRDEILDIFNEFTRSEEHSILVSSHILSDLEKICDYILYIHNGKIKFCEEKDRLLEKYMIVHCGGEELKKIPRGRIVGVKSSRYGTDALVSAGELPDGVMVERPCIEDIMLFMSREV